MLGEPVYVIGDDFKDYFNQLAMAESELHKLNIVFLREPGEHERSERNHSTQSDEQNECGIPG